MSSLLTLIIFVKNYNIIMKNNESIDRVIRNDDPWQVVEFDKTKITDAVKRLNQ